MKLAGLTLLVATALSAPSIAASPVTDPFAGTTLSDGLLPVHVDKAGGRVLLTLPAPDASGISGRFILATQLRTGLGSAELGLDRAQMGPTRLVSFRRIGKKVALQYENPRFRAGSAPAAEQQAAHDSFPSSIAWMGDVVATLPDGRIVIDPAGFLTSDTVDIAGLLTQAGAKGFHAVAERSTVDATETRVFPDNIELEAVQTYAADAPNGDVANVATDPRALTFTVHYSLVRLPDDGYRPRRFDPRIGTFAEQAVDFAMPLGGSLVYDLADRFRLEKTDPAAARSPVKKPITFYIDRAAPTPIRQALYEGVSWWKQAFDAAGLVDAFRVEILPDGVDPLDVRYNVVNWIDRATRGWSYGQVIADPRTGEIIKGSVLLGALRVRQDILIYEGLVGADQLNSGGANDPVRVALARLRQLGAHEVGHALGFSHNFAGSTQGRSSVMDYPPPRIGLKDGAPDLSDAYATGIGAWDKVTVDWLYGTDSDAAGKVKADAAVRAGMRFVSDADARGSDVGQPWGSLWDDGADPAAELARVLQVRRAALDRFGLGALTPGEPVADLRRKIVPIWLLHRYEVDAAAKLVGGVDYSYSVLGDGRETSAPVAAAAQRAAIAALLATLSPDALRLPDRLIPLLSAGQQGNPDRQFTQEVFANAGDPVFDPLAAADVAARITLDALLSPARLTRLEEQHARNPTLPGADELIDRLLATTGAAARDDLGQRIAWRTIVRLAQARRDAARTSPGVAALIDDRLTMLATRLAAAPAPWGRSLARTLHDHDALAALLTAQEDQPRVPPGMPIGDAAEYTDQPLATFP